MKRFFGIVISIVGLGLAFSSVASADVNNFKISDYEISYHLGRDSEGHSTLRVVEKITAEFPRVDQNRGIERAIPEVYDGRPVDLKVVAVKDESGEDRQYQTRSEGDNRIVRIGDPNKYVYGRQVYEITYTQRNVTKNFSDTASDEFYWDTVGTDWRVPISRLSVSLEIEPGLSSSLTGSNACYIGVEGSDDTCDLEESEGGFEVAAANLSPGENITLAIGFGPGTFAEYEAPLYQKILNIWLIVQGVLVAIAVAVIAWISVRYYKWSNRTEEQKPIAPEYLPPKDSSVVVAADLLNTGKSFTALLIDLAVRRYINIHEVKPKTTFKPAEFEIEVIKPLDDLRAEEREVVEDIFNKSPIPGDRLNLKKLQGNFAVHKNLIDNPAKTKKLVREDYELRAVNSKQTAWYKRLSMAALVLGVLLLSPVLLVVALVAYIMSKTLWPLTDKGLAMVRYLKGLKMYVKLAEADRIKTLQSPEGAERVGDISDEARLIKLYERLLPYAVIFGVEEDWNRELGRHYESANQSPDWYVGQAGAIYSGAAFAGAMNSFQSTSTYASPSSSSSGGSSGGGFSGGGGGGGGGGGW